MDSSTGGYLVASSPPPLSDQNLNRVLHDLIAGITSYPNELVRPSWYKNPQPTPSSDTDWVSYGITNIIPDSNIFEQISDDGLSENFIRHEQFDVDCIFYGDNAQLFASALRDGLALSQNNEVLYQLGMAFIGSNNMIHTPELINDIFYNRVDYSFTIRREVKRTYPILSFLAAYGQIYANIGVDKVIIDPWEV